MGNLHLRFDEGRVGRATRVALSPTLPAQHQNRPDIMLTNSLRQATSAITAQPLRRRRAPRVTDRLRDLRGGLFAHANTVGHADSVIRISRNQ